MGCRLPSADHDGSRRADGADPESIMIPGTGMLSLSGLRLALPARLRVGASVRRTVLVKPRQSPPARVYRWPPAGKVQVRVASGEFGRGHRPKPLLKARRASEPASSTATSRPRQPEAAGPAQMPRPRSRSRFAPGIGAPIPSPDFILLVRDRESEDWGASSVARSSQSFLVPALRLLPQHPRTSHLAVESPPSASE